MCQRPTVTLPVRDMAVSSPAAGVQGQGGARSRERGRARRGLSRGPAPPLPSAAVAGTGHVPAERTVPQSTAVENSEQARFALLRAAVCQPVPRDRGSSLTSSPWSRGAPVFAVAPTSLPLERFLGWLDRRR